MHKEILAGMSAYFYTLAQLDLDMFIVVVKTHEVVMQLALSNEKIETVEQYTDAIIKMLEEDDSYLD
jgi:hypothetical protein